MDWASAAFATVAVFGGAFVRGYSGFGSGRSGSPAILVFGPDFMAGAMAAVKSLFTREVAWLVRPLAFPSVAVLLRAVLG